MIRDIIFKPLTKDASFREGKVYCKLWDRDISVDLYDQEVTLEYAEKCAEAMNAMPETMIDAICRAAKQYCIEDCTDMDDEYVASLHFAVPINEDTPPKEILKCIRPTALVVPTPEDPTRIGFQLSCDCDWELEHGLEIDILDDRLVYLGEYTGESPWEDCSDEGWNYAAQI